MLTFFLTVLCGLIGGLQPFGNHSATIRQPFGERSQTVTKTLAAMFDDRNNKAH